MSVSPDRQDGRSDAALEALARAVPSAAGHFDEWRDADGGLRPHWQRFADHAGDLDRDSLARTERRIARQIAENGVTYTVYGSDAGRGRPWMLDALPMLVTAAEWAAIEPGLRQIARVLDALAQDLYGARQLLRDGTLPPALVFPHRGFLRACDGIRPPGGTYLHTLALDLARAPDGRWQLAHIRAQAPSGLGYAIENRATLARVFPEAMRNLRVQPLMPFCDALQDVLLSSAPCESGAPLLVLLTPGRFSETYFEHVYLARQLGVPLVEGGDLTVRHDRVFLKTVAGLRPVHAIWRRLDDDYSDPVELRTDSTLGVPGLVQAWRAGHVLVANAFGLSVLESPAMLAVLPRIAESLTGEPLALPVISTTWPARSGETAAAETIVIKPALSSTIEDPTFGRDLDARTDAVWRQRLADRPDDYAIQTYVPLSQAPASRDGVLESRGLMLRAFLITDGRGDYRVLPGGLSRIAGHNRAIVSSQRGGGSKDTWVLGTGAAPAIVTPLPHRATPGERATPSRVAEHLFWLGRYAERSENAARLLRSALARLGEPGALPAPLHRAIVRACLGQGLLAPDAAIDAVDESALARSLAAGIGDVASRQSLGFDVAQLDRTAGSVRDRLSSDNWRVLHGLFQRLTAGDRRTPGLDEALDVLDEAIVALVAIGGLEMAHMTRDDGWRFLSLGRHIERLAFVAATLADVIREDAADDPAVLEWLLDLSDSLITYRARHVRRPERPAVLDLLLYDERNPRAAMFQIGKIAKHVRLLPDAELMTIAGEIDALHARGRRGADRQGDLFGDAAPDTDMLPEACQRLASQVSDALTLRYFSHVYELAHATVTG
jgi:uncharacterized circularly permuted ATP-grasp superfamily protein/uncharacterized alpha-E superfamily protein